MIDAVVAFPSVQRYVGFEAPVVAVKVADPSAQTNIASNIPDQVNLESVGSGSGLLDLTRESDDTSLGAELLDEIAPAERRVPRALAHYVVGTWISQWRSDVAIWESKIYRERPLLTAAELSSTRNTHVGGESTAATLAII